MKKSISIKEIQVRKVLDSWGNPTLEVEIETERGAIGRAISNKGDVLFCSLLEEEAIKIVNRILQKEMIGMNVLEQVSIDGCLRYLSEIHGQSHLGANVTIGVSKAVARAASNTLDIPLYRYIGGVSGSSLPTPMMKMISGGKQENGNNLFSEIMVVPKNMTLVSDRIRMCVSVYRRVKEVLKEKEFHTGVGDGGGFCPHFSNDEEALEVVMSAIEKAGYTDDFSLSLNASANEKYHDGKYDFGTTGNTYTTEKLLEYYQKLVNQYPILSIEDGFATEDVTGWKSFTSTLGDKIDIVGNEFFKSSLKKLRQGIQDKMGNSIIIRLDQIGTVTEAISVIKVAKANGYVPILSHCAGETEDAFIADLSVALNLKYLKGGAPIRSENMAKYNQLLRIEEELI